MSNTSRLPALDTLRAFAILIVLLYHYKVVVSGQDTFGYVTQVGWMGVDLFFVLSGYLIGDQILGAIARHEHLSLGKFYLRRLLRTLPNYYAVYLLYLFGPELLKGSSTSDVWRFLTFTQNFEFRPGVTFSHSWSLCIEEQFYCLAPLIFIATARSPYRVLINWLLIIFAMGLGLGARIHAWESNGQSAITASNYYHSIYYASQSRFDELLPGIAIAMLKNFHPTLFKRTLGHSHVLAMLGMMGFGSLVYFYPQVHYQEQVGFNFFLSTFGYTCLALSFMCIVFSALAHNSLLGRKAIPGAGQLAIGSYAVYLIHKPVFKLLIAPIEQLGISSLSLTGAVLILALSILAGWVLFICVETPFMRLRQRLVPTQST
jgi:peptidoglycan/LPS O-acetylase OafA/YrhL